MHPGPVAYRGYGPVAHGLRRSGSKKRSGSKSSQRRIRVAPVRRQVYRPEPRPVIGYARGPAVRPALRPAVKVARHQATRIRPQRRLPVGPVKRNLALARPRAGYGGPQIRQRLDGYGGLGPVRRSGYGVRRPALKTRQRPALAPVRRIAAARRVHRPALAPVRKIADVRRVHRRAPVRKIAEVRRIQRPARALGGYGSAARVAPSYNTSYRKHASRVQHNRPKAPSTSDIKSILANIQRSSNKW